MIFLRRTLCAEDSLCFLVGPHRLTPPCGRLVVHDFSMNTFFVLLRSVTFLFLLYQMLFRFLILLYHSSWRWMTGCSKTVFRYATARK